MAPEHAWAEYRLMVLDKLQRLHALGETHERNDGTRFAAMETRDEEIATELAGIRADIAALKVQAGVWGLIGGAIPVVITLILLYIERRQ